MTKWANGKAVASNWQGVERIHNSQNSNCGVRWWRAGMVAALAVLFFLAVSGVQSAQAQTLTILHSFNYSNGDGTYPWAGLVTDTAGNLYGTTSSGGLNGHGAVFELVNSSGTYTETVLYSFTDSNGDGAIPYGGVILDSKGDLFGTTYSGGSGYGTVFELVNSGGIYTENILYRFTGTNGDGANPRARLVMDSSGDLFGTTYNGGVGYGTVFELADSGSTYTYQVLHSFTNTGGDGENPNAGLVTDSSGNLYGTTVYGGSAQSGTVFKLTKSSGTYAESVLYSFSGINGDGANPYDGLVADSAGNLYGTTGSGGLDGYGTVFKITTSGQESVLYSFQQPSTNGASPFGGVALDSSGDIYGTTEAGGAGYGTVFELADSSGTYTEKLLHSFTNTNGDGLLPYAGLIRGAGGNLFGTTIYGGSAFSGTVFEVALSQEFSAFSAKLDITSPGFQMNGAFTLASGAAAINPVTQNLTLTVGTSTVTIPAGSFIQQNIGNFNYQGTINGVSLSIEIKLTGANAYSILVEASGVNLTTLTNPVPVTLNIGDNTGTAQVTAQF